MPTQDEHTFQVFLTWLPTATPAGDVMAIMRQYRRALIAQGVPDEEAGRRVNLVVGGMNGHDAVWPLLFDKIYASDAPIFRTTPNAFLQNAVAKRSPGVALEVCMGEGRNAVYLATKGWAVTGFDVSEVGLQKAQRRAEEAGVSLTTALQYSARFEYGVARWDLVALIYAPVPVTDPLFVAQLERALKPGGLVVVESFVPAPDAGARRAVDIDPQALQKVFSGFKVVHYDDAYDFPDWAQEHQRVVRLVAEKP